MKKLSLLIMISILTISLFGYTETKTLTAKIFEGQTFNIDCNEGDLEITSEKNTDMIKVTAQINFGSLTKNKAQKLIKKRINLRIKENMNSVKLVSKAKNVDSGIFDFIFGNPVISIDLTINVPEYINLKVNDSSGNIYISNIKGNVEVNDGSGDMKVSNIGSNLQIHDSSGNINVKSVGGTANIKDSSGDIYLKNINNNLELTDGSGNIDLENIGGAKNSINDGSGNIHADRIKGELNISDGSGNIKVYNVSSSVNINDGSGNINVINVAGNLRITDGSGSIKYKNIAGSINIQD